MASDQHGLTRRHLIASGVAGAAVLTLPPAVAAATTSPALRRSTWVELIGATVDCDGTGLKVLAVDDLDFAVERSIVGHEDAFVVELAGPELAADVPVVRHPAFGSASLFVAPVDRPGSVITYQLLVDRTVRLAAADPPAAGPGAVSEPASVPPEPLTPAAAAEARRYALLRSARVARRRGSRMALLRFHPAAAVQQVAVRLQRGNAVLARGRALAIDDGAEVRLRARTPIPHGRYDLLVTAVDRDGRKTTVRRPVAIQ